MGNLLKASLLAISLVAIDGTAIQAQPYPYWRHRHHVGIYPYYGYTASPYYGYSGYAGGARNSESGGD